VACGEKELKGFRLSLWRTYEAKGAGMVFEEYYFVFSKLPPRIHNHTHKRIQNSYSVSRNREREKC